MVNRKLHRWIGLLFSFFVLMAAGSGIVHNYMTATQSAPPRPLPSGQIIPAEIQITPAQAATAAGLEAVRSLVIREIGGAPYYQLFAEGQAKPLYVDAVTGLPDSEAESRYAAEIASRYLGGASVRTTDYLTSFNREYIEIFRILPVHRLDADDGLGTRLYVSTMTGSVTRHTDNRRQWAADVFGIFHKLAFIRDARIRNGLLTFTTSGVALTALTGLVLFLRTRKKSRGTTTANSK